MTYYCYYFPFFFCRFPNNVVQFKDGFGKSSIGIISDISHTAGVTDFFIRRFEHVRQVFDVPFLSKEIGTFRVQWLKAKEDVECVSLEEIKGKFYAVHESLQFAAQPESEGTMEQSWIVTLLRHSETPP